MRKALKRFLVRLGLVALIAVAAYGGWRWGDAVFPRLETSLGIGNSTQVARAEPATPEAADLAWQRIEAFRESEDAAELRLTPLEVSSLLRYSLAGMLPGGVADPAVRLEGDRIEFFASVTPSALPDLPDLGGITGAVLPDTVSVSAGGSLIPFGDSGSMLVVDDMFVGGIAIPPGAFPDILAAVGRRDQPGLPPSAILAPAFREIRSAYVEDGELVLVRRSDPWQES